MLKEVHRSWFAPQPLLPQCICFGREVTNSLTRITYCSYSLIFTVINLKKNIFFLSRYNIRTDKLEASVTTFRISDLNFLGKLSMAVFRILHLVNWVEKKDSTNDKETYVECNNLTLINFVLIWNGPTHEATLTTMLLIIQVCTCITTFYHAECGWSQYVTLVWCTNFLFNLQNK